MIDLVYKGVKGGMKYEFIVHPGADPGVIKMSYTGIDGLSIDASGNLIIHTALGDVKDERPYCYQDIDGRSVEVATGFKILNAEPATPDIRLAGSLMPSAIRGLDAVNKTDTQDQQFIYAFEVASYDPDYPLIIDPGLEYSTFLGGSGEDRGYGIAVDSSGNVYVTGFTVSREYPTTSGAYDTSISGYDAFVTKINPAASGDASLSYSTFLGGSGRDYGQAIALDSSGNAYVTGYTESTNFPTTAGAYDTSYNGGAWDVFVSKINSAGSDLAYSTFLGNAYADQGYGIAVDSSGNAYVTGDTRSIFFPTTAGAFDTGWNGSDDWNVFVSKINPAGSGDSDLVYSTFLRGSADDYGRGIAVDSSGRAYVTGYTDSTGFPTTSGAYDTSFNSGNDVFVSKINPAGSGTSDLVYSTFLGGSGKDYGHGIAVDSSGSAYVTGDTWSSGFPTTSGASDRSFNGSVDVFVSKINPAGSGDASLSYSTFLGGSGRDYGQAIAL
ncbi:MAG: SBBP repeat-containing protein, partial [Candidatus Brocadiales bacterium]